MVQLVVRIVLPADGGDGRPLGVLLGDSLLGDDLELQLVSLAQLGDERAVALGIADDGVSEGLIDTVGDGHQVAGVDVDDLVAGALDVEGELDAAVLAVVFAVALARVAQVLDPLGDQGHQAEAVRDELVGQHGVVDLDLDQVDGDGRYFSDHDAAERVGRGHIHAGELERDPLLIGLDQIHLKSQSQLLARVLARRRCDALRRRRGSRRHSRGRS